MEAVYICTQREVFDLSSRGYNVKQMWECQWAQLKQNDPVVRDFADKLIGHPEIIFEPEGGLSQFFGLAKCTVLPPYGLYNPVLPLRQNDKLTFLLCRTCVEEEMSKPMLERSYVCPHTPEQHQITDTWCTPELEKGVEKGYQILHIHEVWHFPEEQQRVWLFQEYVNTWLKIKEERAAGPSTWEMIPTSSKSMSPSTMKKNRSSLTPLKLKKILVCALLLK